MSSKDPIFFKEEGLKEDKIELEEPGLYNKKLVRFIKNALLGHFLICALLTIALFFLIEVRLEFANNLSGVFNYFFVMNIVLSVIIFILYPADIFRNKSNEMKFHKFLGTIFMTIFIIKLIFGEILKEKEMIFMWEFFQTGVLFSYIPFFIVAEFEMENIYNTDDNVERSKLVRISILWTLVEIGAIVMFFVSG